MTYNLVKDTPRSIDRRKEIIKLLDEIIIHAEYETTEYVIEHAKRIKELF